MSRAVADAIVNHILEGEIVNDFSADGPFTNDQVDAIARAWQAVVEEGIP